MRAQLVRLLPPTPRKHEHGVWHPSEKYTAWPMWSPEKLVEKQGLYEQYVDNWYRAHPDAARRAAEPPMTEEEKDANGLVGLSEKDKKVWEDMANMTFEEWEAGGDNIT